MFTNLNLTDMETCYKMFRREVVQSITIESRRFGIEPEITAKVARRGYRIYEVPISYYGRTYEEGKKIGWKDAFSALWTIVRHGMRETEDPKNVGHVTLARMAKLEPYNRWLVGRFRGMLGRRILEIGAGFGNLTRHLIESDPAGPARELVVASDLDPVAVEYLKGTFRDDPAVRVASYRFPLDAAARQEIRDLRIDTIVCCNVLEHIERTRRRSPTCTRSWSPAAVSPCSCPRSSGSTGRSTSTCPTSGATRRRSSRASSRAPVLSSRIAGSSIVPASSAGG